MHCPEYPSRFRYLLNGRAEAQHGGDADSIIEIALSQPRSIAVTTDVKSRQAPALIGEDTCQWRLEQHDLLEVVLSHLLKVSLGILG